jgi:hypothetical protein
MSGAGADRLRVEESRLSESGVEGVDELEGVAVGPVAGGGGGFGPSRARLTKSLPGTRTERSGIMGAERVTACLKAGVFSWQARH